MYRSSVLLCTLFLGACASSQLNYNTLDLAGSVGDLYVRQVLLNLSRVIDDPNAMPSQLDISGGVIQTNFSVTPSASAPINHQVARNATGLLTSTTLAGASASLNVSDSSQQNWSVAPVTDSNSLRNLRALYNHAVWGGESLRNYTPAFTVDGKHRRIYDPFFTSPPHCIKCGSNPLRINPLLGKGAWLYWTNDFDVPGAGNLPPPGADVINLGHYANHTLFVLRSDHHYLDDFVLFTMPVSEPSSGDKSGGAGKGPRTPTRHPFSAPPSNVPLSNPPQGQ